MTGRTAPVQRLDSRGTRALPVVVALAVVAVMAGALWSVSADRAALPAAGPGQVAMPGGLARVDQVVSAARPMGAMPGMGVDNDPVAEGERRVSVEVTLAATREGPLRYDIDSFTLDVPGAGARTPHRSVLPGEEIPAGTQLSGTLVFDVPTEAISGVLAYRTGGSTEVTLPPETAQAPMPGMEDMPGMEGMPGMEDTGTAGAVDDTGMP